MTPEEAGERILEGKAWDTCAACRGEGMTELHVHDEVSFDACIVCHGYGVTLNYYYAKACETLGMDLPKPDERLRGSVNFEIQNKFLKQRVLELADAVGGKKSIDMGELYGMGPAKLDAAARKSWGPLKPWRKGK